MSDSEDVKLCICRASKEASKLHIKGLRRWNVYPWNCNNSLGLCLADYRELLSSKRPHGQLLPATCRPLHALYGVALNRFPGSVGRVWGTERTEGWLARCGDVFVALEPPGSQLPCFQWAPKLQPRGNIFSRYIHPYVRSFVSEQAAD